MAFTEDPFSWCVYHSDWQAETFAKNVRASVIAVSELGWSTSGATGDNEIPQHMKARQVRLIDDHDTTGGRTPTFAKAVLPIGSNDAGVYSVSGTPPVLTYKGTSWTIMGFSGEVRSLPRAG